MARERINAFERMLWRVCRGNVFLRQADVPELIVDPLTVGLFRFFFLSFSNRFLFRVIKFKKQYLLSSFKVNN